MSGLNENKSGLVRPSHVPGSSRMGDAKLVPKMVHNHRQALGNINQNIMGATHYHCVVNKREVSGKDVICGKNASITMNMPVTRKSAEEPVVSEHHCLGETKKLVLSDLNSGGQEDSGCTDVQDYDGASDIPTPVFVRHTGAMLDDINCSDEVEMEDVEEDSILDIDVTDFNNPLAVVEYVDDIYAYYRKNESYSCASPNYMVYQFDINEKMRAILLDWLIEVHYKFQLMEETIFLTINLIDRFLDRCTVARKKLQLVGVTAMLLACKYEEVSVPMVEDFVLISEKAYTRRDVLDMEKLMVNTLQFNMSIPTSYVFMRRFLKAAQSDRKLELLSFFIIELCLVEYEMLKFSPSLLAAASIYTAQCSLYKSKQWSKTSEWHTKYSEYQLLECSKLMVILHLKAATGKLTGVYRKYSTSTFGFAAQSEPAKFLLDLWQC